MAQIEVYEFLKGERASGNDDYFNAQQIYLSLKNGSKEFCLKNSIYMALVQLEAFGYFDVEKRGKRLHKKRVFRLKEKYVK